MHVYIIDLATGVVIYSGVGPEPGRERVAGPPMLQHDPTTFQRRQFRKATRDYRGMLRRDVTALRRQQRLKEDALAAAAAAAISRARSSDPAPRPHELASDFSTAATQVASLESAGVALGTHKVVAILAAGATSAGVPPDLPSAMQGAAIIVAGFSGSSDDIAAWQASLLQQHARWVVPLSPATEDQLPTAVRDGLDGAIAVTLTRLLFAPARYKIQSAAEPALRHLRWLLEVKYPSASAVITGYTDNLPVKGGNLALSLNRANAVESWLINHGVAASRLQAFGYGADFPVAPNRRGGQPLDRRVVVIIDPAGNQNEQTRPNA
jgi:outer membrane protein OmpA-like peptidoglycan-associated protein